jgi:hypothetical protein
MIEKLFEQRMKIRQSAVFSTALYLTVLVSCWYWIWHYGLLFGESAMIFRQQGEIRSWQDISLILYFHPASAPLFLITAAIICLISLLWEKNVLTDLLLFFVVVNIHSAIYSTLTGGDFLLNQFLFFNCLLKVKEGKRQGWKKDLFTFLHNLAVVAIMLQVCLLYLLSGYAKLCDDDWMDGEAIRIVSGVSHFSLFSDAESEWSPGASAVLSYVVIFYQLLFPLLVWVKRIKLPYLAAGILMHVYIALVMGLVNFGVIMIIAYIYFWPVKGKEQKI